MSAMHGGRKTAYLGLISDLLPPEGEFQLANDWDAIGSDLPFSQWELWYLALNKIARSHGLYLAHGQNPDELYLTGNGYNGQPLTRFMRG
jgi:hypothetical protein